MSRTPVKLLTNSFLLIFSDWRRLKVAVAWFLRVKTTLFKLSQKKKELQASDANTPSTHMHLEMKKVRSALDGQSVSSKVEISIIRYAQQQWFREETDALSSGKSGVRKQSHIH